jgi:predicted PurR-regulated permease PerM
MFSKYPTLSKITLVLLFIVLLVHSIVAVKGIIVLVLLAILFAYLLFPVARQLERWRIPRGIADFVPVILSLAIVISLGFLLYKQISVFANDAPQLKAQAVENIGKIETYLEGRFEFVPHREHWLQDKMGNIIASSQDELRAAFATTATTLGKFFIMPFFIFFMLYYRNRFKEFVLEMLPAGKHDTAEHAIIEISQVTRRYMVGLFTVVFIIAAINCISLSLIGVKYAILMGLIAALFNFIPYFGTLIGAIIPLTMTFLTGSSPKYVLFVLIHFIVIQMLEHNFLTPKITGSQVRINPLVTLLSILFGALLFGVAGMFLAIPFTGMFKILCENIESLKPVGRLIGDTTPERKLTL